MFKSHYDFHFSALLRGLLLPFALFLSSGFRPSSNSTLWFLSAFPFLPLTFQYRNYVQRDLQFRKKLAYTFTFILLNSSSSFNELRVFHDTECQFRNYSFEMPFHSSPYLILRRMFLWKQRIAISLAKIGECVRNGTSSNERHSKRYTIGIDHASLRE